MNYMIARQTLNIYIQYLKNLPHLRGYSLVLTFKALTLYAFTFKKWVTAGYKLN